MTATPKETEDISSTAYFGKPVYIYSLKQGIADGFLAPYKVIRPGINIDLEGWRPEDGKTDINGELVEDKEYTISDFDRRVVIYERTQAVAEHITDWLRRNGEFSKTIIFCIDIEHAARMKMALNNLMADISLQYPDYIVKLTGDERNINKLLDRFQDADIPAVAETSELLTTGVDVKTVKLIVLDCNITSMTKFKQIIGRGTRLAPAKGKEFFTIMDFRNACTHFADPDFDGSPVPDDNYEPPAGEPDTDNNKP